MSMAEILKVQLWWASMLCHLFCHDLYACFIPALCLCLEMSHRVPAKAILSLISNQRQLAFAESQEMHFVIQN